MTRFVAHSGDGQLDKSLLPELSTESSALQLIRYGTTLARGVEQSISGGIDVVTDGLQSSDIAQSRSETEIIDLLSIPRGSKWHERSVPRLPTPAGSIEFLSFDELSLQYDLDLHGDRAVTAEIALVAITIVTATFTTSAAIGRCPSGLR